MEKTERRKRLVLINPGNPISKNLLRRESLQPPLGLGIVATLTPANWDVRIIDENFRRFRFKEADLVGITALTSTVYRAYEIAAEYRSRGIPTVLGGIHATLMTEEASLYVDTVVVGEAEATWKQVISDFEEGNLKARYYGYASDLNGFTSARFGLFHPGYIFGAIQTTRGCPMNCDFCSVPAINHHSYRLRDVNEVLDELEAIPHRIIYIVDDNIIGTGKTAREHSLAIFRGMIDRKLNKEWFAYVSLNVGKDEEWIKLAAESGCRMVLIGIESEKPAQLKQSKKSMNLSMGPESYRKVVRLLHKYKICVLGSFIFGMENDRPEDLTDRMEYMRKSPFDVTQPNIMTPFPGTPLFDRIKQAGRLICNDFPKDWRHFHGIHIVYRPEFIEPALLEKEMINIFARLFSSRQLIIRFFRTWWNTKSLRTALWAYNTNLTYKNISRVIAVANNKEGLYNND
ncbi:MAG: radical SAM protein [Bacteroidota bacterium]